MKSLIKYRKKDNFSVFFIRLKVGVLSVVWIDYHVCYCKVNFNIWKNVNALPDNLIQ